MVEEVDGEKDQDGRGGIEMNEMCRVFYVWGM